jgi:hypothetical protein
MTFSSDMDFEGHRVALDMDTADRLLAGTVAPEDAPPGYAEVTRLLEAAWAEPTADEIESEAEVVAMIAEVVRSSSSTASFSPDKPRKAFALTRPRIAGALVAAGLACSAGLASAGALPGTFQQVASAALAKVGISVPDANDDTTKNRSGRPDPGGSPPGAGKSGESPAPARTKRSTGVEKRARPAARIGKHRAKERRPASRTSNRADTGAGSDSSAPPRRTERTGVENRAGPAAAVSVGKGRTAWYGLVSRRSSKARGAAARTGRRNAAAAEPRRKSQARALPAKAGSGGGRSASRSENASSGHGARGSGGQGGGLGSGGQSGGAGSGGQGSGGSGNGNSGTPRGP